MLDGLVDVEERLTFAKKLSPEEVRECIRKIAQSVREIANGLPGDWAQPGR